MDPGFIDVLKRVAGKIDRLDAELSRDAAYAGAAGGYAAELLAEMRALRGALVAPVDLEPSAENARKELRRTADAYAALVKDTRAQKAAWEAKETALETELAKLRQQHGQSERLRRDHSEGIAANKSLRQQLEASATAAEALRERLADRTRLRDSAVAQARSLQEAAQALQARLAAAEGVAAEVPSLKEQVSRLQAAAAARDSQLESLRTEREALLDFAQDAQRRQTEAAATASALESATASDSANAQRLAAARQTVDAQASRIRLLESQLSAADARAGEAAARIEELQHRADAGSELELVHTEVLGAVARQAEDLAAARSDAAAARDALAALRSQTDRDSRRAARLERALESYRRVERVFVERAGQGFWGVNGVAYDLGVALPAAGDAGRRSAGGGRTTARARSAGPRGGRSGFPALAEDSDTSLAGGRDGDCSSGEDGGGAAAGGAAPRASPLQRYIDRLQADVAAETTARCAADAAAAQERAAAQLAAARAETAAASAALEAASAARDEALAWADKVRAVEASAVAAVRAGARGSSSAAAVVEADWDLVPGFAVVLPGLAAAVGELRAEARRAARRQRVAEAESGDLSEELALLRVEAGADALGRSIATGDVRAALRMARAERDQLRSDVDALRNQQAIQRGHLAEAAERVERYKDRVRRARDLITREQRATAEAVAATDAANAIITRLHGELGAAAHRVAAAQAASDDALRLIAEKDAAIARLSLGKPDSRSSQRRSRVGADSSSTARRAGSDAAASRERPAAEAAPGSAAPENGRALLAAGASMAWGAGRDSALSGEQGATVPKPSGTLSRRDPTSDGNARLLLEQVIDAGNDWGAAAVVATHREAGPLSAEVRLKRALSSAAEDQPGDGPHQVHVASVGAARYRSTGPAATTAHPRTSCDGLGGPALGGEPACGDEQAGRPSRRRPQAAPDEPIEPSEDSAAAVARPLSSERRDTHRGRPAAAGFQLRTLADTAPQLESLADAARRRARRNDTSRESHGSRSRSPPLTDATVTLTGRSTDDRGQRGGDQPPRPPAVDPAVFADTVSSGARLVSTLVGPTMHVDSARAARGTRANESGKGGGRGSSRARGEVNTLARSSSRERKRRSENGAVADDSAGPRAQSRGTSGHAAAVQASDISGGRGSSDDSESLLVTGTAAAQVAVSARGPLAAAPSPPASHGAAPQRMRPDLHPQHPLRGITDVAVERSLRGQQRWNDHLLASAHKGTPRDRISDSGADDSATGGSGSASILGSALLDAACAGGGAERENATGSSSRKVLPAWASDVSPPAASSGRRRVHGLPDPERDIGSRSPPLTAPPRGAGQASSRTAGSSSGREPRQLLPATAGSPLFFLSPSSSASGDGAAAVVSPEPSARPSSVAGDGPHADWSSSRSSSGGGDSALHSKTRGSQRREDSSAAGAHPGGVAHERVAVTRAARSAVNADDPGKGVEGQGLGGGRSVSFAAAKRSGGT